MTNLGRRRCPRLLTASRAGTRQKPTLMRLLHVYSGNLYGGIETMLVTLARHRSLCPEMEPQFALCFEGRLSEELTAAGAPVHMLGNVRVSRPSSVRRARRALDQVLKSTEFDAVICHAPWSQAIFSRSVEAANVPLLFWFHDAVDGRHWLERWVSRPSPFAQSVIELGRGKWLNKLLRSLDYYFAASLHG